MLCYTIQSSFFVNFQGFFFFFSVCDGGLQGFNEPPVEGPPDRCHKRHCNRRVRDPLHDYVQGVLAKLVNCLIQNALTMLVCNVHRGFIQYISDTPHCEGADFLLLVKFIQFHRHIKFNEYTIYGSILVVARVAVMTSGKNGAEILWVLVWIWELWRAVLPGCTGELFQLDQSPAFFVFLRGDQPFPIHLPCKFVLPSCVISKTVFHLTISRTKRFLIWYGISLITNSFMKTNL